MVWPKYTWAATLCCAFLFISSIQQLTAHQQGGSASYIDTFGKQNTLAARLAELVEAEEPLNPGDVERLAAAVK
jgi:hypothetical protein